MKCTFCFFNFTRNATNLHEQPHFGYLRILLALKEYEINVVLNFHGDSLDGTLDTNT